jgi:hypothetical protein
MIRSAAATGDTTSAAATIQAELQARARNDMAQDPVTKH